MFLTPYATGKQSIHISFQDYCKKNNIDLSTNMDAEKVFDLLSSEDSIIRMVVMSDAGAPALAGLIQTIQEMMKDSKSFNLSRGKEKTEINRREIGKMVKYIMNAVGYEKDPALDGSLDIRTRFPEFSGETDMGNNLVYKKRINAEYNFFVALVKA